MSYTYFWAELSDHLILPGLAAWIPHMKPPTIIHISTRDVFFNPLEKKQKYTTILFYNFSSCQCRFHEFHIQVPEQSSEPGFAEEIGRQHTTRLPPAGWSFRETDTELRTEVQDKAIVRPYET